MISIQKRGKVYQYRFEVAKINRKRKWISKSGFKIKNAAFTASQRSYDEYQNGECKTENYVSYGDYLDYWIEKLLQSEFKI